MNDLQLKIVVTADAKGATAQIHGLDKQMAAAGRTAERQSRAFGQAGQAGRVVAVSSLRAARAQGTLRQATQ